ncbi:MAG TPA: STAS domain-containing protein [Thiotrichales bacterium]|nr:STAS domain-containing protein [Thiotrichales bacterium]
MHSSDRDETGEARAELVTATDPPCLRLAGDWSIHRPRPLRGPLEEAFRESGGSALVVDGSEIGKWDLGLVAWLVGVVATVREEGGDLRWQGVPEGAVRLVEQGDARPPEPEQPSPAGEGMLAWLGARVLGGVTAMPDALRFLGELTLALAGMARGRTQMRGQDLLHVLDQAGPRAFAIVSLISFLVGLIMSYMGAVQLQQFGAQVYVADLVAIGMVREIGPLMAAIIMSGRSGAAYAAQLGTMQVNEEVDALRALGVSPMEFLVLPRFLGMVVMMPVLSLYASVVGIAAGMLVAVQVYDIGMLEYYHQTLSAVEPGYFLVGLVKGLLYGMMIALAGCYRGIRCGRSAAAVGDATTSAVVTGIVLIVVMASLTTILFQKLGI